MRDVRSSVCKSCGLVSLVYIISKSSKEFTMRILELALQCEAVAYTTCVEFPHNKQHSFEVLRRCNWMCLDGRDPSPRDSLSRHTIARPTPRTGANEGLVGRIRGEWANKGRLGRVRGGSFCIIYMCSEINIFDLIWFGANEGAVGAIGANEGRLGRMRGRLGWMKRLTDMAVGRVERGF